VKFIAILVLLYFMLGFLAGGTIIESRKPQKPAPWYKPEPPPYQRPLEFLLLGLLLALPVAGVIRSRKQGAFLHLPEKFWRYGPLLLFTAGFGSSFLAWRFLK
jgi:hypothetical protein